MVSCNALKERLTSFEKKHGLERKNKENVIKANECVKLINGYLEELQQPCKKERYSEIKQALDEIQCFFEKGIGEDDESNRSSD